MSHRIAVSLALVLAVLAQSCSTPRIRIEHSCPPCIQLEPAARVGVQIAAVNPSPSFPGVGGPVGEELGRHLQRSPYPLVDSGTADVIFRACPVLWTYQPPFPPLPGQNGFGHLRVRIDVVPAKNPGAPCIYSSTYWSKVHAPGEDVALARAADLVADRVLADLRPTRVCNVVEMDDSDPRVETGIELCRCGHFDAAYSAFSDLAVRAPDSPPVLYDLAVLKESRGEYDGAEALLLKATGMDSKKPFYYVALERVRAARADAEALGSSPQ